MSTLFYGEQSARFNLMNISGGIMCKDASDESAFRFYQLYLLISFLKMEIFLVNVVSSENENKQD